MSVVEPVGGPGMRRDLGLPAFSVPPERAALLTRKEIAIALAVAFLGLPALALVVSQAILAVLDKPPRTVGDGIGPLLFVLVSIQGSILISWIHVLVVLPLLRIAIQHGWTGYATTAGAGLTLGYLVPFFLLTVVFGEPVGSSTIATVMSFFGPIFALVFWVALRLQNPEAFRSGP